MIGGLRGLQAICQIVSINQLSCLQTSQQRIDIAITARLNIKVTCGHICPGNRQISRNPPHSHQKIVLMSVQQAIFLERARRYNPDHITRKRPFTASFFKHLRRFRLLANGDFMTFLDQPGQITIHGMDRNPAHGNFTIFNFAPMGQGNTQGLRRNFRIMKKHFIKIAHPVKQQHLLIMFFHSNILRHHRGQFGLFY